MRKCLFKTALVFIVLLFIIAGIFYWYIESQYERQEKDNSVVLLHEIKALTEDKNGSNPAEDQLNILLEKEKSRKSREEDKIRVVIISFISVAAAYIIFAFVYIYMKIIRPFHKLEHYAGEIAGGNFDVELEYERKNFFGAFTWAFDHMKEEIKIARNREEEAVKENKLIIATLSHDIKTPIASVRAYAEALEAGIDAGYEKRQSYVSTIMKKCDEVTRLTNDLVLHSLSELEKLEINNDKTEIKPLLEGVVYDLNYPMAELDDKIENAVVVADNRRVAQVIENILNNARKYAKDCKVQISAAIDDSSGKYCVKIRDYGNGIDDEDIPFIFDKFYRGKNTENIDGSGLGLYIVRYIMDRMGGRVELENVRPGLEVRLYFKMLDHNIAEILAGQSTE